MLFALPRQEILSAILNNFQLFTKYFSPLDRMPLGQDYA